VAEPETIALDLTCAECGPLASIRGGLGSSLCRP
jgi:hypothetical protein